MRLKKETLLVFCVVLGSIRLLYQLRDISVIGDYLSTFVALLLIYPAVLHVTLRRLPGSFFEKDLRAVGNSLRLFAATSLVIFPLFLFLNHLYQTVLFEVQPDFSLLSLSLKTVTIQVVLVAFPEEFFFRGYLQSIIAHLYPRRFRLFGLKALTVGYAVPITSLIFAASHSFITLRWWHFAIFFPSLIFGWLRERTNGLVAPILFHAASNLLVAAIASVYR